MHDLTHEDKVFQYKACVAYNINTDLLDPDKNCMALEGDRAMAVQAACEKYDPAHAARLRLKANPGGISMSTWAAENGLREHDQFTKENLYQYDEVAVRQKQADDDAFVQRELEKMDRINRERAIARGEDPDEVQVMNPALAGKFVSYAEQVNLDARRELKWKQQGI